VESAVHAIAKQGPYRHDGCVPELFPTMPRLLDCPPVRADIAPGDLGRARQSLDSSHRRYGHALPRRRQRPPGLLGTVLLVAESGFQVARKQLEIVVSQASSEHFISPFAELVKDLGPVMEKTFAHLPEDEFTKALGTLFGCEPVTPHAERLAEPISDREQGV